MSPSTRKWKPERSPEDGHGFLGSLRACGLSSKQWDILLAPAIDEVLCGISRASLNKHYPPIHNQRAILHSVPGTSNVILIIFQVVEANTPKEKIRYLYGTILP